MTATRLSGSAPLGYPCILGAIAACRNPGGMTGAPNTHAPRLMRLRYSGTCEVCNGALPAGAQAPYDPVRRRVRCLGCSAPTQLEEALIEAPGQVSIASFSSRGGHAGASAQKEYERRSARHRGRAEAAVAADMAWRQRAKRDHPAGWSRRDSPYPSAQHGVPLNIQARAAGPGGEQKGGRRLDAWAAGGPGRFVLHDRAIPGTKANIDHLVVAPSGVWVIDARAYSGRVQQVNAGGLLRSEWRLKVGGRYRSTLAAGVLRQMEQVVTALDRTAQGQSRPPVSGVLCFVGAEWSPFPRPFVFRGVHVAWPSATLDLLSGAGVATAINPNDGVALSLSQTFLPA